jgi:hypothetical protein
MPTSLQITLHTIPLVIENQYFEKQIAQADNPYIAKVVSRYATSEVHFVALYAFGSGHWSMICDRLPENKWHRHGLWWLREIILGYVLNEKKV